MNPTQADAVGLMDQYRPESIRAAFEAATEITFVARGQNYIDHRLVRLPGFERAIGFKYFLRSLGLIPEQLRPVFTFGGALPPKIEFFSQLDSFPLKAEPFTELARILRKTVRVVDTTCGVEVHRPDLDAVVSS